MVFQNPVPPLKFLLIVFLLIATIYLAWPSPPFPAPLPDSPQSQEPGDLRDLATFRAYFTNYSRSEVIAHYQQQFKLPGYLSLIPAYRLNYPPEEAFTHIADQTRSNYLEELVYPWRESLFINGYEPEPADDQISFQGQPYKAKITIRYYPSLILARLTITGISLLLLGWIFRQYLKIGKQLLKSAHA